MGMFFLNKKQQKEFVFISEQARYHEAWTSLFKDSVLYIWSLQSNSPSTTRCHSSVQHRSHDGICDTCRASLNFLIKHLEEIDTLSTLRDTLQSPDTKYLKSVLTCCRHNNHNHVGCQKSMCPFVEDVTQLCQDKIDKLPSFAMLLGLRV